MPFALCSLLFALCFCLLGAFSPMRQRGGYLGARKTPKLTHGADFYCGGQSRAVRMWGRLAACGGLVTRPHYFSGDDNACNTCATSNPVNSR
jgi:hypothetical protein